MKKFVLYKIHMKTYVRSLFLNKVADCNFIRKETATQLFSCELCEFFKDTYFEEHLRTSGKNEFRTMSNSTDTGHFREPCGSIKITGGRCHAFVVLHHNTFI